MIPFHAVCKDRCRMNTKILFVQGVSEIQQILNRSQRREAAQSIEVFINIDCLHGYL